MIITEMELCEGSLMPNWYYGLAYRNFLKGTTIWYPLGIHLVVRYMRKILHWYLAIFVFGKCKPSRIDKLLIEQRQKTMDEVRKAIGM